MKYRVIANGSVIEGPVPAALVGVLYREIPEGVPESSVPPPGRFEEQGQQDQVKPKRKYTRRKSTE